MTPEREAEIRAMLAEVHPELPIVIAARDLLAALDARATVYVVANSIPYEGYGEPEAAFTRDEDAGQYAHKQNETGYGERTVFSLLVSLPTVKEPKT